MAEITFIITALTFLIIGFIVGWLIANYVWRERIPKVREEAVAQSRAILAGQFSEQLAPYLPDFPFKPTETRFIGKPIDFLVFKGMDEKDINEVVFVEVKSGKSSLSTHERRLRDVIKDKKVSWFEYKIPEELTKKKELV